MSLVSTNVELAYANVVAATPIVVPIPAFAKSEIVVYYGDNRDVAVQATDYTVNLDVPDPLNPPPPNTTNYQFVTITPLASLIAKIGAGTNVIYVRRTLPLTTDFAATDAFTRDKVDVEFARMLMRVQDLQQQINTGLVPNPADMNAELSATAAAASAAQALASANAASASQVTAAGNASAAATSATDASNSATAAQTSAVAAAASAAAELMQRLACSTVTALAGPSIRPPE